MKEAGKSLGQFVASVLSSVSAATYVPAAVLVGSLSLAAKLHLSALDDPIKVLSEDVDPSFTELALFVVVVGVVAALLDPMQFFLTRLLEGHVRVPLVSPLLERYQRSRFWFLNYNMEAAAEGTRLRRVLLHRLGEPMFRPNPPNRLSRLRIGLRHLIRKVVPFRLRRLAVVHLLTKPAPVEEHERTLLELALGRKIQQRFPNDERRIVGSRLGNTIRSFEDRSNEVLSSAPLPAGINRGEAIQGLLPFAYFAIPERTASQHEYFRGRLLTNVSMLLILPGAGIALAIATSGTWRTVVLAATVFSAVAAYVGALSAADGYGTMLLAIARQYATGEFRQLAEDNHPLLLARAASS